MPVVYDAVAQWSPRPLTITCNESGGVSAYRGVTPAGGYPTADGDLVAGVVHFETKKDSQMTVHNSDEVLVELSGSVAVGTRLIFDTAGKAKAASAVTVTGATGTEAHAIVHTVAGGFLPQYAGWYAVTAGDAISIIRARKI